MCSACLPPAVARDLLLSCSLIHTLRDSPCSSLQLDACLASPVCCGPLVLLWEAPSARGSMKEAPQPGQLFAAPDAVHLSGNSSGCQPHLNTSHYWRHYPHNRTRGMRIRPSPVSFHSSKTLFTVNPSSFESCFIRSNVAICSGVKRDVIKGVILG